MTEVAEEVKEQEGSGVSGTLLKAAATAAAAGAAAVVARKAFSHDDQGSSNGAGKSNGSSASKSSDEKSGGSVGALGAIASGGWDAARDALMPAAEDAAGALGSYLGENGPEILRDRLVPAFIESFNEARQ